MDLNQLDLDINNYSIKDLENFFRLPTNTKYNADDVELKETIIREQLLKSGHVLKQMKRDLIHFLTAAKNRIISAKCQKKEPTTLPKLPYLDVVQYPTATQSPDLGEPTTREQNVVPRPQTDFIRAIPAEFVEGKLNPIETRTITKCLTIDTRFRENYFGTQSSDISIQLPMKLSKVVSMQLSAIELPITFYTVSEAYGNNFLYLTSTYDISGVSYTDPFLLVLPDGNYNGPDLVTAINELLRPFQADGVTLQYPESPFSYMKFTLDVTSTGSGTARVYLSTIDTTILTINDITLDFRVNKDGETDNRDLSTKLGWNLGFRQRLYTGSTFYLSDTVIEPSTLRYVYLAIDDYNNHVNNHFMSAYSQHILAPNILARITLRGSFFSMIMDNNLNIITEPRKYFGPVDIQRLRIRLLDDRGGTLPMNSADFSFCLVFKQLYE